MRPLLDVIDHGTERIGTQSPEYWAFWNACGCALNGRGRPADEADARVTQYIHDGYRLGCLFRPLPCVVNVRR